MKKQTGPDMHETDLYEPDRREPDELGALFAAARELTPADLGAADRFLVAHAGALGHAGGQRRDVLCGCGQAPSWAWRRRWAA